MRRFPRRGVIGNKYKKSGLFYNCYGSMPSERPKRDSNDYILYSRGSCNLILKNCFNNQPLYFSSTMISSILHAKIRKTIEDHVRMSQTLSKLERSNPHLTPLCQIYSLIYSCSYSLSWDCQSLFFHHMYKEVMEIHSHQWKIQMYLLFMDCIPVAIDEERLSHPLHLELWTRIDNDIQQYNPKVIVESFLVALNLLNRCILLSNHNFTTLRTTITSVFNAGAYILGRPEVIACLSNEVLTFFVDASFRFFFESFSDGFFSPFNRDYLRVFDVACAETVLRIKEDSLGRRRISKLTQRFKKASYLPDKYKDLLQICSQVILSDPISFYPFQLSKCIDSLIEKSVYISKEDFGALYELALREYNNNAKSSIFQLLHIVCIGIRHSLLDPYDEKLSQTTHLIEDIDIEKIETEELFLFWEYGVTCLKDDFLRFQVIDLCKVELISRAFGMDFSDFDFFLQVWERVGHDPLTDAEMSELLDLMLSYQELSFKIVNSNSLALINFISLVLSMERKTLLFQNPNFRKVAQGICYRFEFHESLTSHSEKTFSRLIVFLNECNVTFSSEFQEKILARVRASR